MTRQRVKSIALPVDDDGIEIPAVLRPPGRGRASYYVRWKTHGRWREKSTGVDVLTEAKRIGRAIVRGEYDSRAKSEGELSIDRFLDVIFSSAVDSAR